MLLIVIHNDQGGLTITGVDDVSGKKLDWGKFELSAGDIISVTALDVACNTVDAESEDRDVQTLLTEYHHLRRYLTKQGLIK
ncbi:hypothetical protein [Sphingobacterium griseoflavum]|nr:hypothetical protein [Sphingobacterium griseoflavum]